jgi:DNA polymerase III delta subunit
MVYLLVGQDIQAREEQLKKIKQEFLPKDLQDFNLDTLYAKETTLKNLQEKFLAMPVNNATRILVIKDAGCLNEACRNFITAYAGKPDKRLVLVLVMEHYDRRDGFLNAISKTARVSRFRELPEPDAFALNRQIELKRPDHALRILNQLLKKGEAPERILGGLRYAWEKRSEHGVSARRKLKLLLNCDVEIKTGRLKPVFALEKLVVCLCSFV